MRHPRPIRGLVNLLAGLLILAALLAPAPAHAWVRTVLARGNPACDTPSLAWRVDSDTATVWLFGSIHFASPAVYPLCPPVKQAFAKADALAVELDTETRTQEIQELALKTAFLPPDQSLSGLLSGEIKSLIQEQGINLALYERFRPWYFALLVQVQKFVALGYSPAYGLDLHFLSLARKRDMPILEMETATEQMDLLKSLAEMDVDTYMRQFLEELAGMEDLALGIFDTWSRGDGPALAELLFGQMGEHPEFAPLYERLYFERNERMAETIAGYLRGDQNVFVVVGAGHLVGERSVLDELAARGYAAEQLQPL